MLLNFHALQDLRTFGPLESSLDTTKSASWKRHQCEKQCTGEETVKPHRRSGACKKMENVEQSAHFTICAPLQTFFFIAVPQGENSSKIFWKINDVGQMSDMFIKSDNHVANL